MDIGFHDQLVESDMEATEHLVVDDHIIVGDIIVSNEIVGLGSLACFFEE